MVAEGEEYDNGVWLGCWDSRFDERRGMKNSEDGHLCV